MRTLLLPGVWCRQERALSQEGPDMTQVFTDCGGGDGSRGRGRGACEVQEGEDGGGARAEQWRGLASGQILWVEPTGFWGRLDVGAREREESRAVPRCLARTTKGLH